ncbi:MAG TPA: hypothetical protein VFA48_13590 [Gammaproteobacteria bacterium]|nr:hypothetical protein [Gammaproteobacteria bacterium]
MDDATVNETNRVLDEPAPENPSIDEARASEDDRADVSAVAELGYN